MRTIEHSPTFTPQVPVGTTTGHYIWSMDELIMIFQRFSTLDQQETSQTSSRTGQANFNGLDSILITFWRIWKGFRGIRRPQPYKYKGHNRLRCPTHTKNRSTISLYSLFPTTSSLILLHRYMAGGSMTAKL
jgi:hypothetical protein